MRERQTLFESVFQSLEEQILSGRLGIGSRLESINELSARYGVGEPHHPGGTAGAERKGLHPHRGEKSGGGGLPAGGGGHGGAFGPGTQDLDFAGIPHRGGF